MKKLIYCAAALATALFAGSCQRELLDPAQDGSTVTFTVNVPEVATKSIGDAQNVDNLVYAVYRVTGETEADAKQGLTSEKLVYQDHNAVVNGKSTVTLELINDQAYVIVFWAQVANTWFDNDYQFGTKTVTYPTGLVANDDKYSAFYGVSYINDVKGPNTKNITLHRPFAQINIATKDPEKYNVAINNTYVSVANAASGFDVAKEEPIVTENYSVSFEAAPMPKNEKLTVNGVEYQTRVQNTGSKENDVHHYIAMNYVFADGNVDVTYVIDTDHGVVTNTISNVPVAKNHRTNIVGNLLTSDVKYNVELDQDWGPEGEVDNDKVVSVWDGTSMSEPTYDATSNTYTIYKAEELAWLAAAVNGTLPETRAIEAISFSGKTVVLASDINLNGSEWTPIGCGKTFDGIFDGANHTVSNYQINREGYAGLFGRANATISNLNVKDVNIVANHYAGAIVGQGYVKMENCHAENVTITLSTKNGDWGDKAGGIIGQNCEGGLYVKNSSAKNVTITGYRDLGGIAGMAHNNNIVSGCSVENITITQDLSVNYETTTPTTVGAVVGRVGSNATIENNEVVGGIVIEKLASNDETFAELLTMGGNIVLKEGEYTLPAGNIYPGEVNVTAAEDADVTINLPMSTYIPGTSLRLENITFKVPSGLDYNEVNFAFIHQAEVFNMNNCIIDGGRLRLNVNEANINECEFVCDTKSGFDGYGLLYYGMDNSTVNVSNSTFTTLGKAIVLYKEGPAVLNLNVDECTFTSSDETTDKAAIQMHSEYGINGNVNISNSTATGFAGINGGLWYDVNNNTKEPNTNFNITVDGHGVVRVGYTKLAKYPNIWVKDNNYYVFDKDGLAELNAYFAANWCGNDTWNHEYHIGADIDAEGLTWNSVWVNVGWNGLDGLVFDGNNHTISNLKINGSLFGGTPNGGDAGTAPGYVKDITIDNATVTGDHWTAVFWSDSYGEIVYDNVTVKNTSVTGNCNTAIFLAGTVIEGAGSIDNILFKNCKVENCSVVANGKDGQDPTGASVFCGRAFGKTNLTFEGNNSIDNATTVVNNNGLVGGKVYGYTAWYGSGFEGTGACDTFTNWDGIDLESVSEGLLKNKNNTEYYVSSAAGLEKMNQMFSDKTAGRDVVLNLTEDIDFTGKTWTPVDSHADTKFTIKEINGNGHTISNLTINGQAMFRRFAGTGDVVVVVKDITFDNATVNSNGSINTSIVVGHTYQNVLFDNVDVKNSSITGGYKVAPLIGTVYNESTSTITANLENCDVEDVTVKATSYDFCTTGMVAFVYADDNDTIAFEKCTVTNVKLYAPAVYTAHAAIYTTGSETLFNEAEGVTVTNVTFENI